MTGVFGRAPSGGVRTPPQVDDRPARRSQEVNAKSLVHQVVSLDVTHSVGVSHGMRTLRVSCLKARQVVGPARSCLLPP